MKIRSILLSLLSLCVCFGLWTAPAEAAGQRPEILGAAGILMDLETGEILYEKNIHELHEPASTTKILTAILALENLELDALCPIDEETAFTDGSRIYLLEGERITVREVLYGLFLESANDSAVALGKMISGSVADFADLMNQKAVELGARDSHFVNPHGLHDPAHLTTVYDLAQIARYCMQNETFRMYCSTYQHTVPATNLQDTRYFYNTNRLLYDTVHKVDVNGVSRVCKYDGILGVKTGWTSHAGGCLVAAAERDGTTMLAVVMASTDMGRFADCIALMDYGFENFKTGHFLSAGQGLGSVPVKRGSVKSVEAVLAEDAVVTLPLDMDAASVRMETRLEESMRAPVVEGDKLGELILSGPGGELARFDVIAAGDVPEGGFLSVFGMTDAAAHKLKVTLLTIFLLFFALLVIYVLLKRRQIRIKKQRRAARQARREQLEAQRREQERIFWEGFDR